MHRIVGVFLLSICGFFSISALGYQYNFLKDSPVAFFDDTDWKLLTAAGDKVMDHTKDGVKVYWSNPKTGSGGYLVASHTTRVKGLTCRDLTVASKARGRTGKSTYHMCRYPNGWKVP